MKLHLHLNFQMNFSILIKVHYQSQKLKKKKTQGQMKWNHLVTLIWTLVWKPLLEVTSFHLNSNRIFSFDHSGSNALTSFLMKSQGQIKRNLVTPERMVVVNWLVEKHMLEVISFTSIYKWNFLIDHSGMATTHSRLFWMKVKVKSSRINW